MLGEVLLRNVLFFITGVDMFNIFQKRQEKKETYLAERKKIIEERKVNALKNIDIASEQMFSSPCPINNNEMCFSTCVHFKKGFVFFMPSWHDDNGDGHWVEDWPKCKLWR